MRIYRLQNDTEHYQYFLPASPTSANALRMDCTSRAETWSPPEVFLYAPYLLRGDFFHFDPASPIVSALAFEEFGYHLRCAGELLPLAYEGDWYSVVNTLNCVNCLDNKKTVWTMKAGQRLWPQMYAFHPDRLPESRLFKIPETYRFETLLWEDGSEEESIPELLTQRLTGCKLTLLSEM